MDPYKNGVQGRDPISDRDSDITKEWISLAAELCTVTPAAVFGFLTGGPVGAGVAAAAGTLASHGLRAVGLELWERQMSRKERVRVATVIAMAGEEMQKQLAAGKRLREDDFFEAQPPYHSHADEVTESLLLKAQREPEERKLPYIANLIASIAFDSAIDVAMAHQLLRFASELSYRQYCILALATRAALFDLFEDHAGAIGRKNLSSAQTSFLSDCWDLKVKGLLWTGTDLDVNLYEIRPHYISLQPLGSTLADALGLQRIQLQDITPLADLFVYGRGNIPPKKAN
jgi:hypothetical protein